MNKDILEGNKLIAEFMSLYNEGVEYPFREPKNDSFRFNHGKYHTSWDWLMPVVQKIVNTACELPTIDLRKEAGKKYDLIQDQLCNFLIKGVHFYSVQFIQWYNNQNTPAKVDDKKGDY